MGGSLSQLRLQYGGASIKLFERYLTHHNLFINRPRACRRSHISRFTVRLLWAEASLGARWAARFAVIATGGRLGRLAAARARQPAVRVQFKPLKKERLSAFRLNPIKNSFLRRYCRASTDQRVETPGKILPAPKFCRKKAGISMGRKRCYKTINGFYHRF